MATTTIFSRKAEGEREMTPKEALEVFLHPFRGMATGKQIAEAEQVVITALDELEMLKERDVPAKVDKKVMAQLIKGFKVGDWVRHDKLFGTYEIIEIDTAKGRVFMESAKGDGFFNSGSTAPEMTYCISNMNGWYVIDKPAPPKKPPLGLEPRSLWCVFFENTSQPEESGFAIYVVADSRADAKDIAMAKALKTHKYDEIKITNSVRVESEGK